jgi:hypothetical protein
MGHKMKTNDLSFDSVWNRIKSFEGEKFETKTGKPFTFEISGDIFRSSRTNYNIAKSNFEKAFKLVPFDGPSVVSQTVRGPSYIWPVLHDKRIRRNDW